MADCISSGTGLALVGDDPSDEEDGDFIPERYDLDSDTDPEYRMPANKRAKKRNNEVLETPKGKKSRKVLGASISPIQETVSIICPRRSSRSSQSRSISYADADVSEEEILLDEDLKEQEKREEAKKKRVDKIWASFKEDAVPKKRGRKPVTPVKSIEFSKCNDTSSVQQLSRDFISLEGAESTPKIGFIDKNYVISSSTNKNESREVTLPSKSDTTICVMSDSKLIEVGNEPECKPTLIQSSIVSDTLKRQACLLQNSAQYSSSPKFESENYNLSSLDLSNSDCATILQSSNDVSLNGVSSNKEDIKKILCNASLEQSSPNDNITNTAPVYKFAGEEVKVSRPVDGMLSFQTSSEEKSATTPLQKN